MSEEEIKKRIEKLKKVINHHRYLQHVLDKQEISPAALDSLKKELFDLEGSHPELITPDSPTQRVGGKPLEKFAKVRHPKPMLSFNDAFSQKDMEDWLERITKLLLPATFQEKSLDKRNIRKVVEGQIDFFCEPKLDGLAIELIYGYGIFKTGSTRGDGILGEDVTQNLKTIESVPLKLKEVKEISKDSRKDVVVRGEAVITKKNFEIINKKQKESGQTLFANPRNLAAGSIRQLDLKITAQRKLDVIVYDLITRAAAKGEDEGKPSRGQTSSPTRAAAKGEDEGKPSRGQTSSPTDFGQETHEKSHEILEVLGFKTNNKFSKYCRNLSEVFDFHNYWLKNREKLPYEIDGLVVTINNNKIFEKMGVVGKAPRGAIAFKFPLKEAATIVKDINVQVGRTGAITPVAILKPVQIGGVTISRATLHNEDEIKRLGLKIGDTVVVGRAGDVIPDSIRVLPGLRTGKEKEFYLSKVCPVCGTKLVKSEKEVVWRCLNSKCFAKRRRSFHHFVSKGAFNIVGLGPKIIEKLIDAELVLDPADLFKLEEGDISPLEHLAEKSARNIISAIQARKRITLPKLIYALGIRNAGEETSRDLAEHFGTLEKLKKADLEELEKIKEVGPVVAKSVFDWFSFKRNSELLEKLKKVGVKIENRKPKAESRNLKGLTFVLTGGLETMARDEAKEKIRSLGGEISESVSKKTDYVVAGKGPGSKYEIAKKLGVKTINEQEFLKMLK